MFRVARADQIPYGGLERLMDHHQNARLEMRYARSLKLSNESSPQATGAGDVIVARAVARAKAGEPDAIRYLYVRFASNVYGYARSIVRDDHEAEDITQQVFAKLMTAIHKYQQREVPFSAWILRMTHNLAIDHLRRMRMVPCEEVHAVDDPDGSEANRYRAASLRDALADLPAEQRQVLVLRHVVGMTPGEIADQLGKSEGSIHGLHHRGRGALKAALREMGAAPQTA
jgi:RNA polymerase sigma-70 factor, ECF subfamily